MPDGPTTARARRAQQAQQDPDTDGIARRNPDANPMGQDARNTPRARQLDRQREIRDEIDGGPREVGAIDRAGGPIDEFLRAVGVRQFGARTRDRFADEADFVQPEDVDPRIDPQRIGTDPTIPERRRPDVAARARRETATDRELIEPDDLGAEVTGRGVEDLGIRESRFDAVGQRARRSAAGEDEFARPDDFQADVTREGIEGVAFTDDGERRRAGRQFEAETPLEQIDPQADVREAGDGFELAEDRQRDIAVIELDPEFPRQDLGRSDVRPAGDGFAPTAGVERQAAAFEFEDETPLSSVDPRDDVTTTGDGFGLASDAQRRVAAREFEQELDLFGRGELDPSSDIRDIDDGFGLARDPAREVAADSIDDQLEDINVTPSDIELEETDSGEFEGVFEREVRR